VQCALPLQAQGAPRVHRPQDRGRGRGRGRGRRRGVAGAGPWWLSSCWGPRPWPHSRAPSLRPLRFQQWPPLVYRPLLVLVLLLIVVLPQTLRLRWGPLLLCLKPEAAIPPFLLLRLFLLLRAAAKGMLWVCQQVAAPKLRILLLLQRPRLWGVGAGARSRRKAWEGWGLQQGSWGRWAYRWRAAAPSPLAPAPGGPWNLCLLCGRAPLW